MQAVIFSRIQFAPSLGLMAIGDRERFQVQFQGSSLDPDTHIQTHAHCGKRLRSRAQRHPSPRSPPSAPHPAGTDAPPPFAWNGWCGPQHTQTHAFTRVRASFARVFFPSSIAPRAQRGPRRCARLMPSALNPSLGRGAAGGWRTGPDGDGISELRHLPDDRQKARTEEDRGGEGGCGGGGGRRWAVAAALLLVPELVGGGDWERARRRESAFPRSAGGAGASHGSATLARGGAGSEACGAPPPPATRGRARDLQPPPLPLPAPPGFAHLLASLPGSRHASGLRADRHAHARAPWRTRISASCGCSLCLDQGSPPCPRGFEAERYACPCWLWSSPLQARQAVLLDPRGLLLASPKMWSSG